MKRFGWVLAAALLCSVFTFAQDQAPATGDSGTSAPSTTKSSTSKKAHHKKHHHKHHAKKAATTEQPTQ